MHQSVGCRLIVVNDDVRNAKIETAFLYPAVGVESTQRFGPYEVEVALNAPVSGEGLPLVIFSHGSGGSPWTHRSLAVHLARSGFVVGLPAHPGNSRADNSLAGTAANLENRPRHISFVIEAAFTVARIGSHLEPDSVAVIGHSIGGYTALAIAGGRPWAGEHETPDGKPRRVEVRPNQRVRALVLLAPAAFWFIPAHSLADVRIPTLVWTGDRDEITPGWHASLIKNGVHDPALVEHKVLQGAGHFAFLSKFPAAMVRPDFPPSQDPDGFDREQIQPMLHDDIVAFLRRAL